MKKINGWKVYRGKWYITIKQLQVVESRDLNKENTEKILKIFSSPVGKKLIWSMLLIQPISRKELKKILPFSLAVFNPREKLTSKFPDLNHAKNIPEIANALNILRQSRLFPPENAFFKSIFSDKDLFGKNSILRKAESCGLVLAVPRKKGIKTDKYYFLNSNLEFKLLPCGKTEIVENASFVQVRCSFDDRSSCIWPKLKRKAELIIAPRFYNNAVKDEKTPVIYTDKGRSVESLFNTLSWSHEHYNELKKVWNLHNKSNGKFALDKKLSKDLETLKCGATKDNQLYKVTDLVVNFLKKPTITIDNIKKRDLGWRTYLFRRAIREKIILKSTSDPTRCSFVQSAMINVPFRLGGSYDILKCFTKSNGINPLLSPIDHIKDITGKNYEINPLQRSKIFTSLVERRSPGSVSVIRNSQLIGSIFSALFLKSEFHLEFLLTLQKEKGYNKLLNCFPG